MSGQNYKVAWLCEALLVSRSGFYHWKDRRARPSPREVESSFLRARIREEFARSRQTYGSPRLARALGCPGRRNRIARLMRKESLFSPAAFQVSSCHDRQPAWRTDRTQSSPWLAGRSPEPGLGN
jgi:hypothetical protein